MKSEAVAWIKNRILGTVRVIEPTDDLTETYSQDRFLPLNGPIQFGDDFNPENLTLVPPPANLDLDSCREWADFRWTASA